jgi:hypothetical protein
MAVLVGCAACADPGTGPLTGPNDVCAASGTDHTGAITASETWHRGDGPHHVTGALTVGDDPDATLTIEAGTRVCFAPGASITMVGSAVPRPGGGFEPARGGALVALGAEDATITFTAADPTARWGGITISQLAGGSLLSHAVVEYATTGVVAEGPIDIENTVIRQITGIGVVYGYYNVEGRIADTVVDSAGLDGSHALYMEGGTLERTVIRGSGGAGLVVAARYARVRVSGCGVYGNKGDGILVTFRTESTVPINDCNLEGNGGPGVRNDSEIEVDARRNWWGDPAGPHGPAGDGVAGPVDVRDFRTRPVTGIGLFQ